MALTLRNSFPNANGTIEVQVSLPTGAVDGDLLLLHTVTANDVVVTAPGGFQKVSEITGTFRTTVFQKIASSEPSSYWVRWESGTGTVAMMAIDASGSNYPVVHQIATASSGSASTNKVWNEVINVDTNTILFCFGGFGSSAASTPDAAMTERYDAENPRYYLMTQAVAAAGATGTRTATGSSVASQKCITISISEAASSDIVYDPEVWVTEAPVIVEISGEGAQVTQASVLVEIAATGIYVTEAPVLVEIEYVEPSSEVVVPTYYPRAAGTRAIHYSLPEEVTGYAFDPEYSWWATVVPEKGRNMLSNPSFEVGTAVIDVYVEAGFSAWFIQDFGAVGATSGKASSRLTVGAAADNTFDYMGSIAVTPGAYTWSLDVYFNRPPGIFRLQVLDAVGDAVLKQTSFVVDTTGWRRVHITWVEGGSGTRKLRVFLPDGENPTGAYFYTDSWQLENKAYPTTYFDGDMVGFNDLQPNQSFFWEGAPHQSPSVRRANTGAGGRLVSWSDDIGFFTTGITGLGMGPVNIRTQEMSDGSEIHQSSTPTPRDFTVTGRIYAENFAALQEKARELTRLLRPNNTRDGQQGILRFQQTDSRGNFVGAPLDIICVYRDGLGGNVNNFYQQSFPIQFHASQPFPIETIDSAAELTASKALVNNEVVFRDEDGDYINLGTGATTVESINRVSFDSQGRPLVGGSFISLCGDAVEDMAYWDGTNWIQMGAVAVGTVRAIDGGWKYGYPVLVGTGTGVYEYDEDLDSWSEIANGTDGVVAVVIRDVDGGAYLGGYFGNNAGATNDALNLVAWHDAANPGVYTALAEGLYHTTAPTPVVFTMLLHDGYLYVGGNFDSTFVTVGPEIPVNYVARWDITNQVWDAVGSGFNNVVRELVLAEDGFIYAVGDFDRDGGDAFDLRGIARWNGNSWEEPFELVDVAGLHGADGAEVDENGIMWFFKNIGTVPDDLFDVSDTIGPSETFGWKNGIFYPSFMLYSGGLRHFAIGPGNRAIMSVLPNTDILITDVTVPYLNEIEYYGDANAPMQVHLHGNMEPVHVLNLDTGGGVYFLPDLVVGDQEDMIIRTDMQRSLMYSEARTNLYRYMSAGPSSSLLLHLRPGLNRISILADEGAGSAAWLIWRNRYWGIEAASSL